MLFRSVLVSVTLSMGVITLVYCMANLAYFTVLSVDEIMASDAVAMSLMDKMFPKGSKK